MRIGIDARMFAKGFGLARYVEQLVLHLEVEDTENEYIIFLKKDNFDFFIPKNFRFKKVLVDIPWYGWEEQIFFPGVIKKQHVDLMHFPHFNVPLLYKDPFVVTIHDLIMFHYPRTEASTHGPFVYFLKDQIHRFVVKNAVKRSSHILVTSEFTRQDVAKTFCVSEKKMTVTYQAPFEVGDCTQQDKVQNILEKYNIPKPYVLYVGASYPHKNLDGLLRAWNLFLQKYGEKFHLVFVGKEDFFYKRLRQKIEQYQNVRYVGFVPDADLEVLYQEARLYVFPSLYEGFGLPPLEAMTHCTPVVSSNASCLPEVLQDAALYFDPKVPEQIADTLYKGITDESLRKMLFENAQKLLPKYSWSTLAKQTINCYTHGY